MFTVKQKKTYVKKKCVRETSTYRWSEVGESEAFVSGCSLCFSVSDNVRWLFLSESETAETQIHEAAASRCWPWASQHCLCTSFGWPYQATTSVWGSAPDAMKDLFVWRLRGKWRGRAGKIHNIRPKKSMWLLLLVLLEHGNDKIIGQWSSSPSLCLICCCPADPWKLACQTFSWSEILMMLQNISWDRLISDENGVQKTKHLAVNYLRASVCLQPGRSCHFQSSVYRGLSTIAPWNPQEKHPLFAFNWKVV